MRWPQLACAGVAAVLVASIAETSFAKTSFAGAQANNSNPASQDKPVFLDNIGNPLEGALVTLTDTKTSEKNTFITKADGRYKFDDLSFSIDYELDARYKVFAADGRKLSQYDHSANVVRILEIDDSANGAKATASEAKKTPPQL